MSEDLAALPRRVLAEVDAKIDAHMRGEVKLGAEGLEWAFIAQRATRLYLWQLKVPEAPAWWGKWKIRRVGTNWGSVKPYDA